MAQALQISSSYKWTQCFSLLWLSALMKLESFMFYISLQDHLPWKPLITADICSLTLHAAAQADRACTRPCCFTKNSKVLWLHKRHRHLVDKLAAALQSHGLQSCGCFKLELQNKSKTARTTKWYEH